MMETQTMKAIQRMAVSVVAASLASSCALGQPAKPGAVPGQPDTPMGKQHMSEDKSTEQAAFEKANQRQWKATFEDTCRDDWTKQWFLDGEVGTVTNDANGMELKSGPEYKNQAHHMVLWTQDTFEGDLKIEYEFTRLDTDGIGVFILYMQATGCGDEGFDEDITKWNEYRAVPKMSKYFKNMDTYHVSYACGYIRGRRYNTKVKRMNGHSELVPDYENIDDLFKPGVPHRLTFIKTDREIFLKVSNDEKTRYFHMTNEEWPIITHGRIGLRQMYTKWGRYADFKVSVPLTD
jgi:hypothetical protein